MGWLSRSKLTAPNRAMPAKKKKRKDSICICLRSPPCNQKSGEQDVGERQRHQTLPTEFHERIVTEAWQRPAHPDIEKQKECDLADKPENAFSGSPKRRPEEQQS